MVRTEPSAHPPANSERVAGRDPAIRDAPWPGLDDQAAVQATAVEAERVSPGRLYMRKTPGRRRDKVRLDTAMGIVDATTDEAVGQLVEVRDRIKALEESEYILSRRVVEAMEAEGSERMRTPAGIVTIARSVSYDTSILAALREITDPADLDGVYTPAHEEVREVPERWNMAKGRKLLKFSGDHAAIIEDAKIYGSPQVRIAKEAS